MWLRGRFITRRRRGTRQVKRSRDAVHRVARHVDQTFEETDRKKQRKVHEIDNNDEELLAEKKNAEENGRQNPA